MKPVCDECLSMTEITRGRVNACVVCRGDAPVRTPEEVKRLALRRGGIKGGQFHKGKATHAAKKLVHAMSRSR